MDAQTPDDTSVARDPIDLPNTPPGPFDQWPVEVQLQYMHQMMRDVSRQSEPQMLVRIYSDWIDRIHPSDGYIALSRRDLLSPWYRITRSQLWEDQGREVNPWKQRDELPLLDRGFLGQLIYGEVARTVDDLDISTTDPAYEHLAGYRSLQAIPQFENGVCVNMVVRLSRQARAFDPRVLPMMVWSSNLFSRATKNLVLTDELRQAYALVDRELQAVSDIQKSLLPESLPPIPGVRLSSYYQTSHHAGGDYYDCFDLGDGRFGVLIADVSGHGTPAAVMMAVTHAIAHNGATTPDPPASLMTFLNQRLSRRYTHKGMFVTAFYGVYDSKTRSLVYCSAGHNPPRVYRNDGSIVALNAHRHLPLGIIDDEVFEDASFVFSPGDVLVLYTDGITEARAKSDELFGIDRLDESIGRACSQVSHAPDQVVDRIVRAVQEYSGYTAPRDDQTLLVATFDP